MMRLLAFWSTASCKANTVLPRVAGRCSLVIQEALSSSVEKFQDGEIFKIDHWSFRDGFPSGRPGWHKTFHIRFFV
jgi:hypothetical protein